MILETPNYTWVLFLAKGKFGLLRPIKEKRTIVSLTRHLKEIGLEALPGSKIRIKDYTVLDGAKGNPPDNATLFDTKS